MKIIGIDPGYERLGIAIIEGARSKETLVHSECFKTDAKSPFEERLFLLVERVKELSLKHKPEMFAIENLFLEKNQKTAMRVAEVRGALLYLAKSLEMSIAEFTPLQIKDAIVGFGRGDKKQMEMMVKHLIKIDSSRKIIDDEYDAIAIALTCSAVKNR